MLFPIPVAVTNNKILHSVDTCNQSLQLLQTTCNSTLYRCHFQYQQLLQTTCNSTLYRCHFQYQQLLQTT